MKTVVMVLQLNSVGNFSQELNPNIISSEGLAIGNKNSSNNEPFLFLEHLEYKYKVQAWKIPVVGL